MKHLKLTKEPGCPARHLTQDEIEAICMGRTVPVSTDWREQQLLGCQHCLKKAELELETLRELRMALRSFPVPAAKHYTPVRSHRNCIAQRRSTEYQQAHNQCYAT